MVVLAELLKLNWIFLTKQQNPMEKWQQVLNHHLFKTLKTLNQT